MSTMDLNATLLKEMSAIAANEDMMRDVISYIRHLRRNYGKVKNAENTTPYTMEELSERIEHAEKNYEAGHYTTSEQLHKEMNNLFSKK